MDFAHLVNHGNEQEFRDSIASYLDVDGFLRFIAVNTLIVNLDTLLAMPQNYYLHLGRDTNKFVFFRGISISHLQVGRSAENLRIK